MLIKCYLDGILALDYFVRRADLIQDFWLWIVDDMIDFFLILNGRRDKAYMEIFGSLVEELEQGSQTFVENEFVRRRFQHVAE